jgi:tetratricopeptide (TPR) repeat protein
LADRRRFDEALACVDRALALYPAWPEALLERASILSKAGDTMAAIVSCEQIIKADPNWFAAWQLHASLLHDCSRFSDAIISNEKALALKPDLAEGHAFRGALLLKSNRPREAIQAFDRALSIDPSRGTAHVDRGLALHALGRYDEAFEAFDRGDHLAAQDPHVEFVIGLTDLLHGRWENGLRKYERRLEIPGFNVLHRHFLMSGADIDRRFALPRQKQELRPFPRWSGEPPEDAPILLETEQGIGDAIQFAGFAAHLARLGHRVQLLTLPTLAPLLRTVPGVEMVVADARSAENLDPKYWLPLMSVPHVLKLRSTDIRFEVPYLSADAERVERWKARIGSDGFRIGIAWQGNRENWLDAGRSIPLAAFGTLANIPGVRLISLQKSPGAEQIEQVEFRNRIERVVDESDKSADALLDTAAVIANLDLVVTSDSMIAHLAGALGCNTFVALRRVPDWRWLLDREDSPFYPRARLFRQTTEGDWTPVFDRIADAVHGLAAGKTSA